MLYSGIDLHRRSLVVCTVNDQGTVVSRAKIKTESEPVIDYFRQWGDPHQAVIECTSNWYWLCDLLRSEGIATVLAHAKYLKAISYAKVKTDAIDAHTLAQLLRMGYIPEAHQLPREYRAMRDLLRQRMVMEHKRTILMQHAGSILAKFNITDPPVTATHAAFADFVATCALPEEYQMTVLMYHHQCLQVTAHERQLEHYFKSKLRPTPTLRLLVSIPGIGDITGAIIAMETGNIWRFADAKHYCSYCRLAPGARDSGGKHHLRCGSKDGNQYLKYAFTEAAIKAMMYYPDIKRFADLLQRRANPIIARTVVAKELAKIVYYVLTRQHRCTSFKGIPIRKRSDWPRTCKPVRLTGEPFLLPPA
jgi:transposase